MASWQLVVDGSNAKGMQVTYIHDFISNSKQIAAITLPRIDEAMGPPPGMVPTAREGGAVLGRLWLAQNTGAPFPGAVGKIGFTSPPRRQAWMAADGKKMNFHGPSPPY